MAIVIPSTAHGPLSRLARLDQASYDALLEGLRKADAHLRLKDLASDVARISEQPADVVKEAVSVLANLYAVRSRSGLQASAFADEVIKAMEATGQDDVKVPSGQGDSFKEFVASALSLDHPLGATAKVLEVTNQYPQIFCSSRVVTDIRPVFGFEVQEKPTAAVIVHSLKITFHAGSGDLKEFFVALDARDIVELKGMLERALHKETSLRKLLTEAGVRLVDSEAK